MRLEVISFTRAGALVCGRLVKRARELGLDCRGYVIDRFLNSLQETPGICPVREPVAEWTKKRFDQADGLVYIGAAGIAVRAIAPCLKDKMTDPAVIVIDEKGEYVISLLSGHMGGANELARTIAGILGARPVITTASDVRRRTAIDVWAKERGLRLSDRTLARQVAAALLDGEPVGCYSDYPLREPVPEGFCRGELCRLNVWITHRMKPGREDIMAMFLPDDARILRLVPQTLTVGIGCKKGVPGERIWRMMTEVFERENLDLAAVAAVASIDIKKDETGIRTVAEGLGVPYHTFPARVLAGLPGEFTPSAFVTEVTGTDNVCERSALAGAGNGALLVRKQAADGITIAVAGAHFEIGSESWRQERTKERGRHEFISDYPGG